MSKSNWKIYQTFLNGRVIALKPPENCPLQEKMKDIYFRTAGVVRPGVWSQKSLDFEIFGDLIDEIYEFMCDIGADIRKPVEEEFKLSINLALAEVIKVVGIADIETTPKFRVHRDSNTGCSCDVYTVIFYIFCTAIGGGLKIFETKPSQFGPLPSVDPITTISCTGAIIMKGDVFHCPESIFGEGERGAVVFQFPTRV
jgi:hypothetical protein